MDARGELAAPLLERRSKTRIGRVTRCIILLFRHCSTHKNELAICAGPLAATFLWAFLHIEGDDDGEIASMIAILSWVFIWWVTEAIPVAITALAPLFLLPFAQIRTASETSKSYMNDTIFLLIGSFILAAAVEHYNLHKRMALRMLVMLGGRKQKQMHPWLLLLGFCVGPAFVSMWIHNTAAAVMMMPVGLGVLENTASASTSRGEDIEIDNSTLPILRKGNNSASATSTKGEEEVDSPSYTSRTGMEQGQRATESSTQLGKVQKALKEKDMPLPISVSTEEELKEEERRTKAHVLNFCKAVVLAIAYGVTLGGMATLTGTGVNLILAGLYESAFPSAAPITYLQWMMFGCPLAWLMVIVLWVILCLWFCPRSSVKAVADFLHSAHIEEELTALGATSFAEWSVLGVFGILVVLWLTKSIGTNVKGWADYFDDYPGNGTISVVMATVLFVIPSKRRAGEKLMDWKRCKSIPWGIILLLGGGFALADGMTSSGLSDYISDKLEFLQVAPYLLVAPAVGVLAGAMTEFTSNNSTATIFVSLVAQVATSIGLHPLFLMVPAAVGAQLSFMLPIATPANAVAYAPGYLRIADMLVVGFVLKAVALVLLALLMPTLGALVFNTNS